MALGCTTETLALLPNSSSVGDDEAGSLGDTGGDADAGDQGSAGDLGDEGTLPDLPGGDDEGGGPSPLCTIPAGSIDGPLPCEMPELADAIAPTLRWTWDGVGNEDSVVTTPLVANLDDDNQDGFIDVCDTPDVLAAVIDLPAEKTATWPDAHLYILAGDSGIDGAVNPAIADLDGDGIPEIVALESYLPNSPYSVSDRRLVAFSNQGELLWQGDHWQASRGGGAIAIADLDGDGSPEILAPEYVADNEGTLLWEPEDPAPAYAMPVAVDLDLDGTLEVLFGGSAYRHDGTLLFSLPMVPENRGSVAVANFDDDPFPEIYVQYDGDHGIFEHDGVFKSQCPTGGTVGGTATNPVAIHDLDGDGAAELLFGFQNRFYVLTVAEDDCSVAWSKMVDAADAIASGTMFDLLDDGSVETIYADRSRIQIYSETGELLFQESRTARESISNPVVADVDGDGAAEILVASSQPISYSGEPELPTGKTLMLIANEGGSFAPTRRVWNQHTYHHSNVREDARVPTHENPHWQSENSFRTNVAATGSMDVCIPPGS